MVSVLSGRNIILELSLKVDEKKNKFFFRGGRRTTRKKLVFLRRPKVESSKVRFGPERTDTILLAITILYIAVSNKKHNFCPDICYF